MNVGRYFFPYDQLQHRTILLYGFHFSLMFIFFLAPIRDLLFGHYFNFLINGSAFFVTVWSYYLLNFKKRITLAIYLILTVAIVPLYILIYYNNFENLVVIYIILLPLASFFLLDFKPAIAVNVGIYLSLSLLLYSIAVKDPLEPTLHNPLALINIAFATILIISFGVTYHFSIFLQMKKLQKSNIQKDILLKEVHHRVKNNLNITASMLGLQALKADELTAKELKKSKSRIEAIATVHEMLYLEEDFEQISFTHYIKRLKDNILNIYGHHSHIVLLCNDTTLTMDLDKMVQVALIINELITNTIKHTDSTIDARVTISLSREKKKFTLIYFEESAKIISSQKLTESSGLGIKLINLSTKQLDGTLNIDTTKGIKYILEFDDVS